MMAVKDHPLEALLFLALTTSKRKGEILGLTWMDVDWEKIILTILLYFLTGTLTKIAVNSLTFAKLISHQQFTLEFDGILNTQLTFYPFAESLAQHFDSNPYQHRNCAAASLVFRVIEH
jgi:integrase